MWIDVPNFIIMFKGISFPSKHNIVHLDITCYVINHGAFESECDYSCWDQHFHSSTPVCKKNEEKEKIKKQTPYTFSFGRTRSLLWNMNSQTRERDTRTLWDLVEHSKNKLEVKGQRGWETQDKAGFQKHTFQNGWSVILCFNIGVKMRESRARVRSLSTLSEKESKWLKEEDVRSVGNGLSFSVQWGRDSCRPAVWKVTIVY